jgi:3-methyl-2-oxobutanoate hydroxymethyltransferase
MGHIGLMPQKVQVCGGYKVVGRDDESAAKVLEDALALQEAGAFAVVLECIPEALGRKVTEALAVPTIGIGSGKYCSGQVQVITDLLGLMEFKPKHARRYAEVGEIITGALKNYADDVRSGTFPAEENSFQ